VSIIAAMDVVSDRSQPHWHSDRLVKLPNPIQTSCPSNLAAALRAEGEDLVVFTTSSWQSQRLGEEVDV